MDIGAMPTNDQWIHFAFRVVGTVSSFLFVAVSWAVRAGVKRAIATYTHITTEIETISSDFGAYRTRAERLFFLAGIIDENGNSTGRRCS